MPISKSPAAIARNDLFKVTLVGSELAGQYGSLVMHDNDGRVILSINNQLKDFAPGDVEIQRPYTVLLGTIGAKGTTNEANQAHYLAKKSDNLKPGDIIMRRSSTGALVQRIILGVDTQCMTTFQVLQGEVLNSRSVGV